MTEEPETVERVKARQYECFMEDHEPPLQVAYERHRPARAIAGMQASADPDVAFGGYVFDAEAGVWRWKGESLWATIRSAK